MRYLKWLLLHACLSQASSITKRDHDNFDYFALHLHDSSNPVSVATSLNVTLEGSLGELPHHYIVSCPKEQSGQLETTLQDLKRLRRRRSSSSRTEQLPSPLDSILWHQRQTLKQRHVKRIPAPPPASGHHDGRALPTKVEEKLDAQQQADKDNLAQIATTLNIGDPIFQEQWHLYNYMQKGIDANVTGVWLEGVTGTGVISAIIDDGLDFTSNDLKQNYYADGSWDFNNPGPEPKPRLSDDRHGTRCAGEIGAARNNVCGVGMAYDSKVAGIRILSAPISDEDEAVAMNYRYQENDIYSCSWGPPDDGQTMEAPSVLIRKAMVNGIQQGRQGKGSVFVFAAGNGALKQDNCNFDGYTNSIYSITTGAIDRYGDHPYYSEKCSALILVAPSSGHGDAIHTTDVGTDSCVTGHGGTSAAGPLMAGAAALALSVRPELTWRDMQRIAIDTAVPIHLDDGDWQDTVGGKKFSHTYGYGKLDTYGLVQAAKTTELLKPQAWYHSPWISVQHEVPQGDQGLAASFDVTDEMLVNVNFEKIEHVTVTMNVNHTRRGDLSVELKSPDGRTSHIATTRKDDREESGYVDWTFMSVVHWGEAGRGTWTVIVKDTVDNENKGTFIDWRLNLWGECIDATKQELHPLPTEHDDDHDTTDAVVSTTSVEPVTHPTSLPLHPTDHPDRPTKPKPTNAATITYTATSSSSSSSSTTATSQAGSSSTSSTTSSSTSGTAHPTSADSFLPGFFPTFGVSKKTQIWIYGSIGLIVVFCAGLGVYFVAQRRKRLRNSRDNYEFEMLDDQDMDESKQGLTNRRKRRGGELYDAFAGGESDEDIFSEAEDDDDDDEVYQDTPSHGTGSGSGSPPASRPHR